MPQGSQRSEHDQNYGRYIPEIEAEEVHAKTGQGQQRRPEEKAGHSRQTSRRQKELTAGQRLSLLVRKQERQIPSTQSPAPCRAVPRGADHGSRRSASQGKPKGAQTRFAPNIVRLRMNPRCGINARFPAGAGRNAGAAKHPCQLQGTAGRVAPDEAEAMLALSDMPRSIRRKQV